MFVFVGFSSPHAHLPSAHFSAHFFPSGGRPWMVPWLSSCKAALLQVGVWALPQAFNPSFPQEPPLEAHNHKYTHNIYVVAFLINLVFFFSFFF